MTGGIMQLVAKGVENLYLTDDPQVTFFKIVYRRHTNFSIESIPQYFNTTPNFSTKVSCLITKNGDLINKVYLVVALPSISTLSNNIVVRWVNYIGYALLKNIELEIGGQVIETLYGDWLYIYNQLNKTNNDSGLDKMIGNIDELIRYDSSKESYLLYIPIPLWFSRYVHSSLPIIALQHSDVKINIEFSDIANCIITGPTHYIYLKDSICLFEPYELIMVDNSNYIVFVNFNQATSKMGYIKADPNATLKINSVLVGMESKYQSMVYDPSSKIFPSILVNNEILNLTKSNTAFRELYNLSLADAYLYVDYVYLDNVERVKFARSDHEYLIDVCQFDNDKIIYNSTNKIKIGYSFPTKEIFVRAQLSYMTNTFYNDPFNYTNSLNKSVGKSLIKKILLKLNGFNREIDYDKNFYTYIQALQHHNTIPPLGLFMYSFSLTPFDYQPAGSANLSKIDDISIDITVEPISYANPANVRIYAFSYNVLRIIDGVAGLAFFN